MRRKKTKKTVLVFSLLQQGCDLIKIEYANRKQEMKISPLDADTGKENVFL